MWGKAATAVTTDDTVNLPDINSEGYLGPKIYVTRT